MNNYSYDPPKDSMIKINIQTSINNDSKNNDSNDKFKNYKSYSSEQSTDVNYNKSHSKSTKTIRVTNWSIKIK